MYLVKLDLQYFAGEKTEKATPKKRNDARKKGQTAKSQDVNTAIGILVIFFFFSIASDFLIGQISSVFLNMHFKNTYGMDLTDESVHEDFY